MRRAGVRTFAEAENYEADRKRRALEEGGARGDRAHARHRGRADEDDPAILAQVNCPPSMHAQQLWRCLSACHAHVDANLPTRKARHSRVSHSSPHGNMCMPQALIRSKIGTACTWRLSPDIGYPHAQASAQLTGGGLAQRYAPGSVGVTVASELASWRSRRGVGLDITALPDINALSAKVS